MTLHILVRLSIEHSHQLLLITPIPALRKIKTYPPPPSHRAKHPFPVADWQAQHLKQLDPTGSRTRLFDRNNPDVSCVGDILLVTFKTGDPFAGVCLSIKRRGVDTGILLRNKLLMVGVEMWVKVYSPSVQAIEVVKRAEKRARRARLYYMRYVALVLTIYIFSPSFFEDVGYGRRIDGLTGVGV